MTENSRWHASWIISLIIACVVAVFASLATMEMVPLIILVVFCFAGSLALLWLLTDRSKHIIYKVIVSAALLTAAVTAVCWVVRTDRPILRPQVGVVLVKSLSGNGFALAVEGLVKNSGRQGGYADDWKLTMTVDGSEYQGKQLHGQQLPSNAPNEQELSDQEFPSGKPVRGWLFFSFPAVSHDMMVPYFTCNSELINKVGLMLSVWDSKQKKEWTQTRTLKELGVESCIPPVVTITKGSHSEGVKHIDKGVPASSPSSPKPESSPDIPTSPAVSQTAHPTAPASTPAQTMNCEGSNCVLGPNFGNQFLVQNPGRGLNQSQFADLVTELKKLEKGSAALVLHEPIDREMNRFGGQLQSAFQQAGWSLPAYPLDISRTERIISNGPGQTMRNTPEGMHCVVDGSKLGNDLMKVLSDHGVHCSVSNATLYPPPSPQPNLTMFMGRNLE
jgi:hypothetical protein